MLPKKAVKEFIEIYKKTVGETLSMEKAIVIAQKVFGGLNILLKEKKVVDSVMT